MLGRIYEYFLGQFAGQETGKDTGAFYTTRSLVKTLVEMLEPLKEAYLRPCGWLWRHIRAVRGVRAGPRR